jgi:acyl-CoA synthetase (AMP-forming)/AMP-acid ligase II
MTDWITLLKRAHGADNPAIVAADTTWTGRELLQHAASALDWLAAIGVPEGAAVPALLETNGDALALVAAGAAGQRPLALLGPRLTVRELCACVDGLDAPVIVAQPEFAELAGEVAAASGRKFVVVEPFDMSSQSLPSPRPSDPAVILHTSGTTGAPKAVRYRHDRLARRVIVNAGLQQFERGSVFATASPFHHIAGLGNILVALGAGGTVVAFPKFSVEGWRALTDYGVTHALAVPTMIEMLLREDALPLATLRVLQYGASPIHPETLRRAMEALPGVDFLDLYGQTEGSPITCLTPADHHRAAAGREWLLQSVGRAAPGVEVRIEAPDDQGVGEVTARAAHLFCTSDDGWLRTGDMGRLDEEGYLYLVGRRGDKIIRGGENVYPLEIENVLQEHPQVADAAVVGVADRLYGEVVKAFVVPADQNTEPDVEELRTFVRSQLAGFKVPTEWAFVPALPRNATGKLLRRELLSS